MGLIARIFDEEGRELACATAESARNQDVFTAVARAMERFRISYPSKNLVREMERGCVLQVKAEQTPH